MVSVFSNKVTKNKNFLILFKNVREKIVAGYFNSENFTTLNELSFLEEINDISSFISKINKRL